MVFLWVEPRWIQLESLKRDFLVGIMSLLCAYEPFCRKGRGQGEV